MINQENKGLISQIQYLKNGRKTSSQFQKKEIE
jgi:hypothetical protein